MKKIVFAAFIAIAALTACDDTTNGAGAEVMPEGDDITTSTAIFATTTRSVAADRVLINTSRSYLGCVIDPETNALTKSSFLAQYRVMDDLTLPDLSVVNKDEDGKVRCDSCSLRLYFTQYYGDSLATMKVRVRELSQTNIMEEGQLYYSDLEPNDYLSEAPRVDFTSSYSIYDPTNPSRNVSSSSYYRSITLKLPSQYGADILQAYYTSPTLFQNAYNFIHHICPGFYIENVGGMGSLINVEFSTLDLYFSYQGTTAAGKDTTYVGMSRMAATEEVLQNTTIETSLSEGLLSESNPFTLLKSPAGAFTEITLPVSEIFSGEHANDTLNSAQLIFDRYNTTSDFTSTFAIAPPANVLLLPKSEVQSFFEEGKLPDNITSYLAEYSNGAYAFSNIGRLIKTLYTRRESGDADWNKVWLIPVDCDYTTITTYYSTSNVLTRVRNALGLNTVRLSGASGTTPQVRCVYSHFE